MVSVKRQHLPRWVPYAVLVAGIALTVALTWTVARATRDADTARFEETADEARRLLILRLDSYIELLHAVAGLFAASDDVTVEEFRRFVAPLAIAERHPGLQGLGFAPYLRDERGERTPVMAIEPDDERNRAAIGFDMFSDPARRAAMQRARDTRRPAASGIVRLMQETSGTAQAGFLIFRPVFRDGALQAFVYSPFRGDDLLGAILAPQPGLAVRVYDGPREDPAALLHRHDLPPEPSPHELLRSVAHVDVAGREWTLVFEANQHAGGSSPLLAPAVLLGGLLLSLALFGITRTQFLAWENAARYAAEMRASEESQRETGERLRRLVALEREARAEAQQADRAKDEFLATLSHELRTPLNAMLGWITMLRSGRVRDDRRADAMEVIERNARTQARLIEDLLDVSRIITGKVRLELQPLQLAPIVRTAVEAMRPTAETKSVTLHASIATETTAILGDPNRLQQIVWNLLSNAIKFTPPGGEVRVELVRDERQVHLTVRDTGIGIEAAFLPHVFERFRQADSSSTRQHSGVGLGLAIVRHLVDLHGGTIEAHSDGPNTGASFVVHLPAAARVAGAHERGGDDPADATLARLRVLLVEDDGDTRDLLAEALRSGGAEVTAVDSAEAALTAASGLSRQADFHAIVSDIGMAGVDGYELMRRIRRLPGERGGVPSIAVTAYARPGDRERALAAGFNAHVSKPVDIDALMRTIASLVHNARLGMQTS